MSLHPGHLRKLQIIRGSAPAGGTSLWRQPGMEIGCLSYFAFYFRHHGAFWPRTPGWFRRQLDLSMFCLYSRFHGVCCNREWCCCGRRILYRKKITLDLEKKITLTFKLSSIWISAFDMDSFLFWVAARSECGREFSQIVETILFILPIFVRIGISEFCKLVHNFLFI